MTSVERKRDLENKREASRSLSRRRASELKEEKKKRRLILYDSESDDDKFVVSPRIKALVADNMDEVKEGSKSDLALEVGKQAGEVLVDSGVHEYGCSLVIEENSRIDGLASNEEVKLEPKSVEREERYVNEFIKGEMKAESNNGSSSEFFEKTEENGSNKAENASTIEGKSNGELVVSVTVENASPNAMDQEITKEDIKVDSETILRLEVVNKGEDADGIRVTDVTGASQNGKCFMVKKKSGIDRLSSKLEKNIESEKFLESKVVKKGEEVNIQDKRSAYPWVDQNGNGSVTREKTIINLSCSKEEKNVEEKKVLRAKLVKKGEEACFSGADNRRDDSSSRKMKNNDQLTTKQDNKLEPKKILKSEVHKESERAESVKNKSAESSSDRKRSRETLDDKITLKKFRSGDVKHRVEMETGEENIKRKKTVASDCRQRDGTNEKRMEEDSKKKYEPEAENCRWIERSTARTLRKLKANHSSVDVIIDDVEISQQKGLGVHGKGGVLRVLPSNKKVGGIEGGHIRREQKEEMKNIVNHSLLSKERKNEKPISTTKPVKSQLNPRKASVMTKLSTKDNTGESRATVKQRIRDQIKEILLDAGWTIDLRPRKGRCYEDAVYVPPTGGAGFWSITKAYDAYMKSSGKKSTQGAQGLGGSTFATVPAELLQMLTRNVINKRRSREEIEMGEKLVARNKGEGKLKIKISKSNDGGKARKKRGCALLVRGSNISTDIDDDDDYVPYVWKRTILSWMVDLSIVHVDDKVKYMNKKKTRALLEGSITRDGIRCGCCSKIVPISKFEIHAGSKLLQPYEYILMEGTGTSLLQCQLNAWEKQQESERQDFYKVDIEGDDPNDDTCGICGDGGDLICCDNCPSTFHLNCLGLQMLPPGDWHCTNCSCRYCGLVDTVQKESGSDTSTLLVCSQCEKKYHHECIPEADAIIVCSNDSDTLFCGKSCRKVFWKLQKLLGTKNDLEAGLSWRLICRCGDDSPKHPCNLPQKAECNSKIAVAFAVMDECFRPIIDHRSGINLIHNVVYNCGSNIDRLSYTGFYTFILEKGDEIIAVASVRIHGTRLAEMPFIGTRNMYRRQGMCRQLLNGIESVLYSLNVEKLIIPAIAELTETWTNIFGFKVLEHSHRKEVSSINMLVFPGTGLLYKPIMKKGVLVEDATSNEVPHSHGSISESPKVHSADDGNVAVDPSIRISGTSH